MGAQTLLNPSVSDVCHRVDEWLSCHAGAYMTYHRYVVGSEPDMDLARKVIALRDILCERGCGLCDDEIETLKNQLKRLMS